MHVERVMPSVVLQELGEDGLAVMDVSQDVVSMRRKAWEGEHIARPAI
jgi:hypothetical protein